MEHSDDIRFWPRVGMYVSREFADEWIGKISVDDEKGARFLDDEMEEFTGTAVISPRLMRKEIEELFNSPFEEGELDIEIQAILKAEEMTRNKKTRVKELRAEGFELQEAKELWQKELNDTIANMLGTDVGDAMTHMGTKGEEGESQLEAPSDDGNTE
tara:strand:+ start:62 stop:535 length:474 start_codon:yes stop_codon:yes gene_type:complete